MFVFNAHIMSHLSFFLFYVFGVYMPKATTKTAAGRARARPPSAAVTAAMRRRAPAAPAAARPAAAAGCSGALAEPGRSHLRTAQLREIVGDMVAAALRPAPDDACPIPGCASTCGRCGSRIRLA